MQSVIMSTVARAVTVLMSASAILACAHTRTTRFDPTGGYPRRTAPSSIRFYGTQAPACPYLEIGRVTAESRLFVSWGRVVAAARKAAHELGGDAIMGVRDASRLSIDTVDPGGVTVGSTSSLSGIVVRFKDVGCMT